MRSPASLFVPQPVKQQETRIFFKSREYFLVFGFQSWKSGGINLGIQVKIVFLIFLISGIHKNMKTNSILLLALAGIGIFSSLSYAQETNSIVSKFDFIPGEKIIFYDDFSSESVGDFPAQWLTNGSGEIVTSQKFPGRWFNMTKMGYYIPEVTEDFTDNFTIEFDFVPMNTANSETMFGLSLYLLTGSLSEPGGGGEPGDAGFQISLDGDNLGWKNWSMESEQRFNGTVIYPFKSNVKYHISIWVQKQRVRLYANESKVLDVPRAIPSGRKPNIFRFDLRDEVIPLISNFRIAAGLPDMRNKLLKDGKIISYGIQFDVNSDKLKPESFSTLKEISDVLKENPGIRVKIVGHTDSDGDETSNLDLSKRRGVSVKNELVAKFGVDAGRLETDGKGESEPVAGNDSAVNKAKNRRVEFIKL
jgi:OOP family OmpA-OmpF porin